MSAASGSLSFGSSPPKSPPPKSLSSKSPPPKPRALASAWLFVGRDGFMTIASIQPQMPSSWSDAAS